MTVRIPEVTDDSLLTAVLEYRRLFQFRCLFVFLKTHDRKFKKKRTKHGILVPPVELFVIL